MFGPATKNCGHRTSVWLITFHLPSSDVSPCNEMMVSGVQSGDARGQNGVIDMFLSDRYTI